MEMGEPLAKECTELKRILIVSINTAESSMK